MASCCSARGLRRGALALAAALVLAGCSAVGSPATEAPVEPAAATAPAAPAPAEDAAFGIVGDTPDGRVSVSVAPGGTARLTFRVANPAGARRAFALRAAHALAGGGFAAAGTAPEAVGAWLSAPALVPVRPRESAGVTATLRVPADAPPGRYAGALVASPAGAAAIPDGLGAAVTYEVAARVTVVVRAGGEGA